jgi:hypothetical protein
MEKSITFAVGYNVPPFLGVRRVVVTASDQRDLPQNSNDQYRGANQFPLTFKADGLPAFTFPIDPIITLGFKNVIARRNVSKSEKRGSVKERWTEDDVDITISGIFLSSDDNYPAEVDQLRAFFKQKNAIKVECSLLNNLDIHQIAIESYDLPFTKGGNNQAYEIKAYSDDVIQLLIEG